MTKPTTYDEINRRTVPDPVGSFRPSPEQARQAREGFRALDRDEEALSARVHAALDASGLPVDRVEVEIERDRVTLRGHAPSSEISGRIADVVRDLDDIGGVVDAIVVG